jgi:hypothetical protein
MLRTIQAELRGQVRNLGYGRFGSKVTMDWSPVFDNLDQFDQKRIWLADIDGSGTTDIIYLEVMHRRGAGRNGLSWRDQGVYGVGNAAATHHVDTGDLDDLVAQRIGARGFDVDDADQGSRLQSPVQRRMLVIGKRKSTDRG